MSEELRRTILAQKGVSGGIKYKTIEVEGCEVRRYWGLVGGAEQTTSHTYGGLNLGKCNEVSPEQNAINSYFRLIEKDVRDGYAIVPEGKELVDIAELYSVMEEKVWELGEVDTSLCVSKPISELDIKRAEKLRKKGEIRYEIKYNGMCHYIRVNDCGEVGVWTRKWHDHSRKYPEIVEAFKKIEKLNVPNTLIIGEMVWEDFKSGHIEKFKKMSEISKVDCLGGLVGDSVVETEKRKVGGVMKFVVFGVVCVGGKDVMGRKTVREMRNEWIDGLDGYMDGVIVQPQQFRKKGFVVPVYSEVESFLKREKEKYEGLVCWDLECYMEVSSGKPLRRAGWKVKVVSEDDVIAYGYLEGKGDKQGKIGSLLIGKMLDGVIVELGKVGSGLRDDECVIEKWKFPCVIAIEYNEIFESGAYQFPRFVKVHEDKRVEDIVMD